MSHSNLKLGLAFTAVALCLTVFTLTAKAGRDSYEIYLNNKLLLKQTVDQSFSLKSLHLDPSNSNDQLVIHYSQCGVIGKGRSIAVKDEKGRILKEWKFSDAPTGTNASMVISVKELLQLAKDNANGSLRCYYTSEERSKGQVLASFP